MAMATGAKQTYGSVERREDLLDLIADVSPDQNYLVSIFGTVPVAQTIHEWMTYYESRPSSNNKSIEGNDASASDPTNAVRKNNITQLIERNFVVTSTMRNVATATNEDAYNVEKFRAMRKVKNDWEYAVLRGTKASGSSGVAREMDGLISITQQDGKATVRASGTSLSAAEFRAMANDSWTTTDEYVFDLLLTDGTRIADFANFFSSSQPLVQQSNPRGDRFSTSVTMIKTPQGFDVELRPHKDMPSNAVLGIRTELCKVGYLNTPEHQALGKTGSSDKGLITSEGTLQVNDARPFVYRTGYNL